MQYIVILHNDLTTYPNELRSLEFVMTVIPNHSATGTCTPVSQTYIALLEQDSSQRQWLCISHILHAFLSAVGMLMLFVWL